MTRPAGHTPVLYAKDLSALSRMLHRVVTDEKLAERDKEKIERGLRRTIAVLSTSATLKKKQIAELASYLTDTISAMAGREPRTSSPAKE